eukprot:GEMP01010046.1.p1 GENE.GEMP01010046.1~~GEMP01010046.1.p1  ORF type:complete len:876 (+),score=250.13 GEMP01010046.1:194-2821(+)
MVSMMDVEDDLETDIPPRYEVLYEDALRRNDLNIRIQERLDNEPPDDGVDYKAGILRSEKLYADAARRLDLRERIARARQERDENEAAAARDVNIVVPKDGRLIPRHEYLYADHFRRVGHLAEKEAHAIEVEREKHLTGLTVVPAAEVDRVVNRLYNPDKCDWQHDRLHHSWPSPEDATDSAEVSVDAVAGKQCSERLYALAKKQDHNRLKSQSLKVTHIDDEKKLHSVHRHGKPNPQVFHDLHNEHKFRIMSQWNARQDAEEKKVKQIGKLHHRSPPEHDVWQGLFEDADDRKHRDRIRKQMHYRGLIPPRRVPIHRPAFLNRGCTRQPKATNYEILYTHPANDPFTDIANVFSSKAHRSARDSGRRKVERKTSNANKANAVTFKNSLVSPIPAASSTKNGAFHSYADTRRFSDKIPLGYSGNATEQLGDIVADFGAESDAASASSSRDAREEEQAAARQRANRTPPWRKRDAGAHPLKPQPAFTPAEAVAELQSRHRGARDECTAWQHFIQPQTLCLTPHVAAGSKKLNAQDFAHPEEVERENEQDWEGSWKSVPYHGSEDPDAFIAHMRDRMNMKKQTKAASIQSTVERIRAQIRVATEAQSYKSVVRQADNTVPVRELNPDNVDQFQQSRVWESRVAGPKAFDAHDVDIFWRRLNATDKVDTTWWNRVLRKEKRSHLEGVKYMEEASNALAEERSFPAHTRARFRQHAKYAQKNIAGGQFQGTQINIADNDVPTASRSAPASDGGKDEGQHRHRDAPFQLGVPMSDDEDEEVVKIQQSAGRKDEEGQKVDAKGGGGKQGENVTRQKYLFLKQTVVSKGKQRRASRALGATLPDDANYGSETDSRSISGSDGDHGPLPEFRSDSGSNSGGSW